MAGNSNLHDSAKNKQDEFYTRLQLIEDELKHYRDHFKGKVVLCNCDDPRKSNFFKYFADNFEKLQLKRLIATCYKSQDVDLFSQGDCERAICQIYEGDKNGNMAVDDDDMRVAYENQKGVCPICKGKFAFEEMRGDHIKPWSKGGKTKPENLQMLCADCNARKSDKF